MRRDFLIFVVAMLMIIGHLVAQGAPPVADFSFSPAQPTAGEEVTFTAAGSYDPDGTIQFFGWDFGDDGVIDEVGAQVRYVFQAPGQYNVKLIVIDNEGRYSYAIKTINVLRPSKNRWDYFPLEGLMGTLGSVAGGFGGAMIGFMICGTVGIGSAECIIALTGCIVVGTVIGSVTAVDLTAKFFGVQGNILGAYLGALGGWLLGILIPGESDLANWLRLALVGFGTAFGYNAVEVKYGER